MVNSQIPGLLTHGLGTGQCAVLRGGSLIPANVATRHEIPELGICCGVNLAGWNSNTIGRRNT